MRFKPKEVYHWRMTVKDEESGSRTLSEYRIVKSIDVRLVVNCPAVWEVVLFYEIVPFTYEIDNEVKVDLNQPIDENLLDADDLSCVNTILKPFLAQNGSVDTIEKAVELSHIFKPRCMKLSFVSEKLIRFLEVTIYPRDI